MGCISVTEVKNPKKNKLNKDNTKHVQTALYKSKLQKSSINKVLTPRTQQLPATQKIDDVSNQFQIHRISSVEFLTQYQIVFTLQESTKLQGPKLIKDKIHGGTSVLRVYRPERINEQRLKKYQQILKFQVYQDDQQNYLIVDKYCAGQNITDLIRNQKITQTTQQETKTHKKQVHNILVQVHNLITFFHTNKTYLGNLNLFSFKKLSPFTSQIRLVEYNLDNEQEAESKYSMGHAHHNSFQADWQFFGYLVQLCYSDKSPIFISHKMQYVQKNSQRQEQKTISKLLKGREVSKAQVQNLSEDRILLHKNKDMINGYRFCSDILRLIRCRKRRVKHRACYYAMQIKQFYNVRNTKELETNDGADQNQELWRLDNGYDNSLLQNSLNQSNLYKLETERIFSSIEKYISEVNSHSEEHFMNYTAVGQSFRKLKQVFIISDASKKMQELKQVIPHIK